MSNFVDSCHLQPKGAETRRTVFVDKSLRICNNMSKGRNKMANAKQEALYHALFLARHLSGADLQDGLIYILYELDMPAHNIGYHYVRNAILLFYRDPVNMLLRGIYQTVIEKVNPAANYQQIEQSMRAVIDLTYQNRDPQIWRLYFHSNGKRSAKRPSNHVFISQIASFMELWQACCKEVSYGT